MPTETDIALSAAGAAMFFAGGHYLFSLLSIALLLCFPDREA